MKKINSTAIVLLKSALSNIYWYKKDLKSFIFATISRKSLLTYIDWNETKKECVSRLVDIMVKNEDKVQQDLIELIEQVCNFNTFSHFDFLPNGKELKENAKKSIITLRDSCKGYLDLERERENRDRIKEEYNLSIQKTKDFLHDLESLKQEYCTLSTLGNFQERGFEFEKFLNKLFVFFDLDPRGSFKIVGEQIDGSFTHEGTDYLLEAKWTKEPIPRAELDIFSGKISRKLKNTLGLFISINSFEKVLLDKNFEFHNMILMDSMDLILVLENRISLPDIIRLKRKHASETGEIMYRINN